MRISMFARGVCGIVLLGIAVGAAFGQDTANPNNSALEKPKASPSEKPKRMPTRLIPPSIDAETAGKKAIELFDTNKDGKLSGKELDKCPGLKAALGTVDTDHQGEITAEMIAERIRAWQRSKLGRMSLSCTVLHKGKPLDAASVRFVPEEFLGENVKAASGKTDKNGVAMISIAITDRQDPPGVAPGLYRVEITKNGEKIPAIYNTETTLGQEVALDANGIQEGIKFNLDY